MTKASVIRKFSGFYNLAYGKTVENAESFQDTPFPNLENATDGLLYTDSGYGISAVSANNETIAAIRIDLGPEVDNLNYFVSISASYYVSDVTSPFCNLLEYFSTSSDGVTFRETGYKILTSSITPLASSQVYYGHGRYIAWLWVSGCGAGNVNLKINEISVYLMGGSKDEA